MNLFDITPVGAFMNAIDAAAEADRKIAMLKAKHGHQEPATKPGLAARGSEALRRIRGAFGGLYDAAVLRLAVWRHQ